MAPVVSKLAGVVLGANVLLISAKFNADEYKCSICIAAVEKASEIGTVFHHGCIEYFPEPICNQIKYPTEKVDLQGKSARQNCVDNGLCPMETLIDYNWMTDVRVVKALGSQGYDKVRISAISNHTVSSDLFSYQSEFKYRWTDKYLSTGLVTVTPGVKTQFKIADQEVNILLPKQGEGTRGVIIADPCFTSQWIFCAYSPHFDMLNHSLEILNAMNANDDLSYWQILGDNFYDQAGNVSSQWFAGLTSQSKSKMFAATPGNHDFWVNSAPNLYVPNDQLGNGFMQFYAQDTIAATSSSPFDYSSNPDATYNAENLPTAANFFFYNQVGNTGFIGYSGAHSYESMVPYFQEACNWATANANTIDVLLLVGHWNNDGDGCDSASPVPTVFTEIAALPECSAVKNKLRYFMGHKHCNLITETDVGFMVGANGMSDHTECGGAWGIPVVDTTGGSFKVYYFPIAQARNLVKDDTPIFNHYEKILTCIKAKGVAGCYDLATLWADVPF